MSARVGRQLLVQIMDGGVWYDIGGMQARALRLDGSVIDATIGPPGQDVVSGGSLSGTKGVEITGSIRCVNEHSERLIWNAATQDDSSLYMRFRFPPVEDDAPNILYGESFDGWFTVQSLDAPGGLDVSASMEVTFRGRADITTTVLPLAKKPTMLTINSQGLVSWLPPFDTGGVEIDAWVYTISYGAGYSPWSRVPGDGSTTTWQLTDVRTGANIVRIAAVTAAGIGEASDPATVTLTLPSAPLSLNVSAASDSAISAVWSRGSAGSAVGGTIQYAQKVGAGEYGPWIDIPQSGVSQANATSYTITGLSYGNTYTFKLREVNSLGASPESAEASAAPSRAWYITTTLSAVFQSLDAGATIAQRVDVPSTPRDIAQTSGGTLYVIETGVAPLQKSIDGALTWTATGVAPFSIGGGGVAVEADGTILAVAYDSESGADPVKASTDDGATWTTLVNLPVGPDSTIFSVAMAVGNDGTWYVLRDSTHDSSADSFILHSSDRGATWTTIALKTTAPLFSNPTGFAVDAAGTFYYVNENNRLSTSADGGATWTQILDFDDFSNWPGSFSDVAGIAL